MSISSSIRRVARAAGVEIYRSSDWRWSHHVEDYYPVDASPRWGYGKPYHSQIVSILKAQESEFSSLIDRLKENRDLLHSIPADGDRNGTSPFWRNNWFENLDPVALVGLIATMKPKRYIEIGSGNSTKFARHAIRAMNLATRVLSVDPEPRASIDVLCDQVIRRGLEYCDLSIFNHLEKGDILFFDGSHRAFTNSDVTVFFLEVVPRLKPGVIVHIHDIFLPADYPPEWSRKLFSEQYMLAAMMLCPRAPFRVLLPCWHVCQDSSLGSKVTGLLSPLGCLTQGWSFWLEIN